MEILGLYIFDILMIFDVENVISIVEDLLVVRINISFIFMCYVFKLNKESVEWIMINVIEFCEVLVNVFFWDVFIVVFFYVEKI